jgi:hypothetical protein
MVTQVCEGLRWRRIWFPLAFFVIAFVALFDTYLIFAYRDVIHSTEQNPIGLYLLNLSNGEIDIFVRTKLAGTTIVLSVLYFLWRIRSRIVVPVTTSVASYQTGLFVYLTAVDSSLLMR